MSAQPEALEVIKQPVEELFYGLMARMPENMRFYKELVGTRNLLSDIQKNYEQTLEAIDVETPASVQPENIAYEALGHYLTGRKIQRVQKVINGLESQGDWFRFFALHGKRIEIEPLGDGRIDAFSEGGFFRATDHKKIGTVKEISLTPSDGGYIKFAGKYTAGITRLAAPLFDRDNDYAPLFRVELL